MNHRIWLTAGATLLLLTACQDRSATDAIATDNEAEATNEMAGNEAMPAPAAAEFASMVAASDLYEIQSGELAAERASSPELKSFAQMIATDHRKSTADLKAAVAGANPPVSVDPVLDQEKLAMIDMLKSAPEADFDRTFVDQQKQAHQKALDLLRQYESTGDNPALKDFAAKASAVVQGHLDKLNAMQL